MPDDFRRFIQDLGRDKTQNVAFIADGSAESMTSILDLVKNNNANLIEDILYIDGGSSLPFFGGKLKPEEEEAAYAWFAKIVEELK